ncbi:cobyric acid synthase [Corynebacterium sp. sy017]|uniref:cobyric acid synthase n=1 Tax=unclassified Corynebacterium TaxID=2624378 RepID=UPI0011851A25|nr:MULTISPECIES: cobyric acid synthase [unclassified Corynebacterium]MBP3087845.1 cobyric acid synthase [Corynebacterium sp. sy017]TSD92388.1 cobyric acid synthase [Corynebacterium sp. SY003]
MSAFLIAGCTSDAGKSMIVAGLCRALFRRGFAVAPFKAQNMSNNSAVTVDGGEIGRAQALQAYACGLEPQALFNPVLLKPGSDRRSQLIVNGSAVGQVDARNYVEYRQQLRHVVADSLTELEKHYDVVICEGAGSPAEINLRDTDIANFGLAQSANLPVYLVGDIDRGGVLAHFYGTHQIVSEKDRNRICGFIVNKFRGDRSILEPGLVELERRTGVPTLAVLPFIEGLWVDAEDSLQTPRGAVIGPVTTALGKDSMRVAAIRLPRISNATDVEALACEPGVTVVWSTHPDEIAQADLVILPGSKATVSDLAWLRAQGLAQALEKRVVARKPILGICGGYQMMCTKIIDSVEAVTTGHDHEVVVSGLAIFDADIEFQEQKTVIRHPHGAYEIHHGQVVRNNTQAWLGDEGSREGTNYGTHRHGYLEDDDARRQFLSEIAALVGKDNFIVSPDTSFAAERDKQLDMLADALEQHWDLDQLIARHGVVAQDKHL